MSVITSQQIARYYNQFQDADVTFTKDVIRATLLYPKNIQLRCLGYQWPVILYSSSMNAAKVIANMRVPIKEVTAKAKGLVQLRYSFIQRDKNDPVSFFLNAKVAAFLPYDTEKPELNFINLAFTNRPPDELILRLGELLEANAAYQQRREERIAVNPETLDQIGIDARGCALIIDGLPRKCILRDISFSGAKLILMGLAPFLVNKKAVLHLSLSEAGGALKIPGTVIRFEQIQGRQDLAAFAVKFDENSIPAEYKMRLSSYLKTVKMTKPSRNQPPAEGKKQD